MVSKGLADMSRVHQVILMKWIIKLLYIVFFSDLSKAMLRFCVGC